MRVKDVNATVSSGGRQSPHPFRQVENVLPGTAFLPGAQPVERRGGLGRGVRSDMEPILKWVVVIGWTIQLTVAVHYLASIDRAVRALSEIEKPAAAHAAHVPGGEELHVDVVALIDRDQAGVPGHVDERLQLVPGAHHIQREAELVLRVGRTTNGAVVGPAPVPAGNSHPPVIDGQEPAQELDYTRPCVLQDSTWWDLDQASLASR